jgi:hypothetical protein
MKKVIALLFALTFIPVSAGVCSASDMAPVGGISADTLSQMGLGGMEAISDDAGMHVRGKGYTVIAVNFSYVKAICSTVIVKQRINVN